MAENGILKTGTTIRGGYFEFTWWGESESSSIINIHWELKAKSFTDIANMSYITCYNPISNLVPYDLYTKSDISNKVPIVNDNIIASGTAVGTRNPATDILNFRIQIIANVYDSEEISESIEGYFLFTINANELVFEKPVQQMPDIEFEQGDPNIDRKHLIKFSPVTPGLYYDIVVENLPNSLFPDEIILKTINAGDDLPLGEHTVEHTFSYPEINDIIDHLSWSSGDSRQFRIKVNTYKDINRTIFIGSSTRRLQTMYIPLTYKPTLSQMQAIPSHNAGVSEAFILNVSSCNISGMITLAYGSSLSHIKITSSDGSTNYSNIFPPLDPDKFGHTTGVLRTLGEVNYYITAYDTRQQVTTFILSINVDDYVPPTINVTTFRSNAAGNRDDSSGEYISVTPTYTYAQIGDNDVTKEIKINDEVVNTSFTSGSTLLFPGYALDQMHAVQCAVTDKIPNTASISRLIEKAAVLININNEKNAVGIGKYADKPGTFDVALPMYSEHSITSVGQLKSSYWASHDKGHFNVDMSEELGVEPILIAKPENSITNKYSIEGSNTDNDLRLYSGNNYLGIDSNGINYNSNTLALTDNIPCKIIINSVVKSPGGSTSVVLFSFNELSNILGFEVQEVYKNIAVLVHNADGAAQAAHIDGTVILNNSIYATFDRAVGGNIRIGYVIIAKLPGYLN